MRTANLINNRRIVRFGKQVLKILALPLILYPSISNTTELVIDDSESAVSVLIDTITPDNIVNSSEASNLVLVTGTVEGDFNLGDVVTVTINGASYNSVVLESGRFLLEVPGAQLVAGSSDTSVVTASVSSEDSTGSLGSFFNAISFFVDTEAPAIDVVVNDITSDNVLNKAEVNTDLSITGAVSGEFNSGDLVSLLINDKLLSSALTAAGEFRFELPGDELAEHTFVSVLVETMDNAGNTASVKIQKPYQVDIVPPILEGTVQSYTTENVVNTMGSSSEIDFSPITLINRSGRAVCSTFANDSGDWSCSFASTAAPGDLFFIASTYDVSGNIANVDLVLGDLLDRDHDGIPDLIEGIVDTDADGVADLNDLDSDNDGLLDSVESIISDGAFVASAEFYRSSNELILSDGAASAMGVCSNSV